MTDPVSPDPDPAKTTTVTHVSKQTNQNATTDYNPPPNCVDLDDNCPVLAILNECVTNPSYMMVNCARSCKKCTRDHKSAAESRMDRALITAKPGKLPTSNKQTKLKHEDTNCVDLDKNCALLTMLGECVKKSDYS